jgi:hypothetical protein
MPLDVIMLFSCFSTSTWPGISSALKRWNEKVREFPKQRVFGNSEIAIDLNASSSHDKLDFF